jgi:hypothetical protein
MESLTHEEIQLIQTALEHYISEQEKLIKDHYLDLDHEELVDSSPQTIEKVNKILPYFNGSRIVYLIAIQQNA